MEAWDDRESANVQWQIDVAVSCAKLGDHVDMPADERRRYLRRGLDVEKSLKASDRLPSNQGSVSWFEERLQELEATDL